MIILKIFKSNIIFYYLQQIIHLMAKATFSIIEIDKSINEYIMPNYDYNKINLPIAIV